MRPSRGGSTPARSIPRMSARRVTWPAPESRRRGPGRSWAMATRPPGMVVSIRWIVTLAAVVLIAAAVLSVGAIGEHSTREALTAEIETRILVDARMLATASSNAMLGDFPELTLHPLIR